MFRRDKIEKILAEVGLITGGFPCQDISIAGKRGGIQLDRSTGEARTRSGLFWENLRIFRLVRDRRPGRRTYWIMENVAEIYDGHLGGVLGALAEGGDDAEWDCLSSGRLGRGHLRQRFYAIAYSNGERPQGSQRRMQEDQGEGNIHASLFPPLPLRPPPHENELPKPFVVGKDDGIPNREHRIKSLGNTIDPEIAEILGGRIYEIERDYL